MNRPKIPTRLPRYLLLALILALLVFYYTRPVPLSEDIEGSVLIDMRVINEECDFVNVTDLVDHEKIIETIEAYSRSKFYCNSRFTAPRVGDIMIWFTSNNHTTDLLLHNSDQYLSNISPNRHTYYMYDGQDLHQELLALIPEETYLSSS